MVRYAASHCSKGYKTSCCIFSFNSTLASRIAVASTPSPTRLPSSGKGTALSLLLSKMRGRLAPSTPLVVAIVTAQQLAWKQEVERGGNPEVEQGRGGRLKIGTGFIDETGGRSVRESQGGGQVTRDDL